MGVCCSNKNSKNPHNTYGFLSPTNRQLEQEEYEELSGEMKEILEMYLSSEKNSPQNRNLGESNQLKHSLEQPNTPYFKNSYDSSDDKFLYLKQSKQVEEIIVNEIKIQEAEKLAPVEEENEQQKQYSQLNHPIFQFKCQVCHQDHNWIHSCNSRLVYNDDNMIVCEKCKFKQKITEYDFICQKTQQKFRFTTEQIKDFEF
ncbi:unnamed protein product (macronuclear) [Paramecium tetraurelia]|uniref:Uncharacterized protein n=1 Tax=Paramecium tetraurelia TaxID=5888 RepID=A0CD13_PARTE|nr:uncharacterized protein GSPATT00037465001 [Paramecium tetraurelia]CAK68680.1 unnamed protein product [Paramecium tetraurelia]|eukprot:XP_001436077.1 hypothetical protein (macronuclear) [Paramecium tetraurelia strain d4-2]